MAQLPEKRTSQVHEGLALPAACSISLSRGAPNTYRRNGQFYLLSGCLSHRSPRGCAVEGVFKYAKGYRWTMFHHL